MKHRMMALAAALLLPAAPAVAQTAGERLFNQQCKQCHTVEKGAAHGLGPNLHGMFDRKAGSVEGFKASDAMKASGISWDDTTLAEYLRDPKGRVPGTTMVHAGIKRPDQLSQLVEHLRKATQ